MLPAEKSILLGLVVAMVVREDVSILRKATFSSWLISAAHVSIVVIRTGLFFRANYWFALYLEVYAMHEPHAQFHE